MQLASHYNPSRCRQACSRNSTPRSSSRPAGGSSAMGSEHGFALRDGEREDACHAAVRRFEPPRECFVVNQAGKLEDKVVLDRQASRIVTPPNI